MESCRQADCVACLPACLKEKAEGREVGRKEVTRYGRQVGREEGRGGRAAKRKKWVGRRVEREWGKRCEVRVVGN